MRISKPPSPVVKGPKQAVTKPVNNFNKPPSLLKRTVTTQTNRTFVFVKEENLHFSQPNKVGADGNMKRDYLKAVNYINSCHKLVNTLNEKNGGSQLIGDKGSTFTLPNITNYAPLFPFLISGQGSKRAVPNKIISREKTPIPSPKLTNIPKTSSTQKKRSQSASLEHKKLPPIPPLEPPGIKLRTNKKDDKLPSSVKNQINEYLITLQADFAQKFSPKTPENRSYDEVVRQKLLELSKFCSNKVHTPPPINLLQNFGDFPSVIMSDIDPESYTPDNGSTIITEYDDRVLGRKSNSSLSTNSSDIKSDSDMELILDKV